MKTDRIPPEVFPNNNLSKGESMTEEQMNEALNAIHDEAARLLNFEGPDKEEEISTGLQLIMSLARYKFDVRSDKEIKGSDPKDDS